MQEIKITILTNELTPVELFNAENKVAELVLDFTGTDYATWDKWVYLKMHDGTSSITNLGTDVIVRKLLTSAEQKGGKLKIAPFAKDPLDATIQKNFQTQYHDIEAWSSETINNASLQDDLIAYFDGILDTKVDKVDGKGLSTEDYTTAEKEKLAGVVAPPDISNLMTKDGLNSSIEKLTFDTTPSTSDPLLEGQMRWNQIDKTVDVGVDGDGTVYELTKLEKSNMDYGCQALKGIGTLLAEIAQALNLVVLNPIYGVVNTATVDGDPTNLVDIEAFILDGYNIAWLSSDTDVATVNETGAVTGLTEGTTTVSYVITRPDAVVTANGEVELTVVAE